MRMIVAMSWLASILGFGFVLLGLGNSEPAEVSGRWSAVWTPLYPRKNNLEGPVFHRVLLRFLLRLVRASAGLAWADHYAKKTIFVSQGEFGDIVFVKVFEDYCGFWKYHEF